MTFKRFCSTGNVTFQQQDLDYGESHNWKSIVLSLLVIGCVIAGIVTAIYLLGWVFPFYMTIKFSWKILFAWKLFAHTHTHTNECNIFCSQICRRTVVLVRSSYVFRWIFARRIINESFTTNMGITYQIRFSIGRWRSSRLRNNK